MKQTEVPYSANEVIEVIEIGSSTLRKWCLALEEHNYNFVRTDQNKRMFSDKDIVVLKQFKILVKNKNLSINNAAEIISNKYSSDPDEVFSSESEVEHPPEVFSYETMMEQAALFSSQTVEELKTEIEQLKSLNKEVLEAFNEQNKYIKEHLEKRDEQLLQALRDSQETKKLLLDHQEKESNKKKGFFGLFGK